MMVRNEASRLERALRSVTHFVDEVCIVDTGSTDGTQTIAATYADRFKEKAWPESFSIARNWSLDLSTCDFNLILDADEYMVDPGRSIPRLRGLLADDVAAIEATVINEVEGDTITDRFEQIRVLRNDKRIRYEHRSHHQPIRSLRRYIDETGHRWVTASGITLRHMGYDLTDEEKRTKYGPRLVLYAKDRRDAEEAGDFRLAAYYRKQQGVGLYLAGHPGSAINTLKDMPVTHLREDEKEHRLSILVKSYLWQRVKEGKDIDEHAAGTFAAHLVARYPNPETLATCADMAIALSQPKEAILLLVRAYEMAGTKQKRMVSRDGIITRIARLMEIIGHDQAAEGLRAANVHKRGAMLEVIRGAVLGGVAA